MKKVIYLVLAFTLLTGFQKVENFYKCTINIVVDIPDADWQNENKNYFCKVKDGKAYVDLQKIKKEERAKWLRDNGKYVNYKESYSYIENIHKIKNSGDLRTVGTTKPEQFAWTNLDYIIKEIGKTTYETDTYQQYVKVFIDKSNTVNFELIPEFTDKEVCFSIPFFRSIVQNHIKPGENPDFGFAEAVIKGKKTIFFKVKGISYFYDYSDQPGKSL